MSLPVLPPVLFPLATSSWPTPPASSPPSLSNSFSAHTILSHRSWTPTLSPHTTPTWLLPTLVPLKSTTSLLPPLLTSFPPSSLLMSATQVLLLQVLSPALSPPHPPILSTLAPLILSPLYLSVTIPPTTIRALPSIFSSTGEIFPRGSPSSEAPSVSTLVPKLPIPAVSPVSICFTAMELVTPPNGLPSVAPQTSPAVFTMLQQVGPLPASSSS